jgi:Glycosyl hydrolase family 3 N terminal domain
MAVSNELSPAWEDFDRSAADHRRHGVVDADLRNRQMGQLFMVGFEGTTVNDQIKSLIEDYHVGSVLLTAKNLKCASDTRHVFWHFLY